MQNVLMHATCVQMWTSSRQICFCAFVRVCNLHMQIPTQGCVLLHGSALLYIAIYAWGQDRDRLKDCHMCGNAATDHFYHIILWAQVCKCVTCLCFSGYAPVLAKRMMKWSQMGKEQNSFLRKKKKKKKDLKKKEEKKKRCECQAKSQESAPFHTIAISIPLRRKSREKRKVTLQWPWNYWFHRESLLEKQAQLLWVLTSLGPDHCFWGSGWIHPVVFIFVWQFLHQLARNIPTPSSAVSPRCDNLCS